MSSSLGKIFVFGLTSCIFARTCSIFSPGWYEKHGTLPTLEEFLTVWDVAYEQPPGDGASAEEKKAYADSMERFEWYVDKYLPRTCGNEFFGPTVRPCKMVSDKILIEGTEYICVNVLTEAFGQVQYENSREKWLATFEWKKQHKFSNNKKVPQYNKNDASTNKFKAKWSDSKEGQGTKWDAPLANQTLMMRKDTISKWRKNDKETGYIAQKMAMQICRKAQDWDNKQAKVAKKGKRAREEAQVDAMLEDRDAGDDFVSHDWNESE